MNRLLALYLAVRRPLMLASFILWILLERVWNHIFMVSFLIMLCASEHTYEKCKIYRHGKILLKNSNNINIEI